MTVEKTMTLNLKSPAMMDWLNQQHKHLLVSKANLVKFSDGQLIHTRGNTHAGVAIIKSGHVKIGVNGVDGTFISAGILGAGETFGEFTVFTALPRTHDISSVGHSEIYRLDRSIFLSLCGQHPEILTALLSATLIRSHILLELLDAMRRLPLDQQLARLLLSLSASTAQASPVIKLKQTDLASSLGTSRVSLGKAAKKLESKDLIKLGYGEIILTNRQTLAHWLQERSETPLHFS
ncbi:MAG: Crp/Fnr family transcriptional regulator [Gammaproteobacteria bacterium]|nr:Crp/Fnr family transcriptional regulator [Gammaproteobacteria bacterium]